MRFASAGVSERDRRRPHSAGPAGVNRAAWRILGRGDVIVFRPLVPDRDPLGFERVVAAQAMSDGDNGDLGPPGVGAVRGLSENAGALLPSDSYKIDRDNDDPPSRIAAGLDACHNSGRRARRLLLAARPP